MASETKLEKLRQIPAGSIAQQPIPTWPKLPQCLYRRHPEDKAELDAYQAACEEFFKKAESRAS